MNGHGYPPSDLQFHMLKCLWTAGQGMNTALEDGAVLAWHLQQGGLSAESMRAFEKERIPRVQSMAEQEYVRPASCCSTFLAACVWATGKTNILLILL